MAGKWTRNEDVFPMELTGIYQPAMLVSEAPTLEPLIASQVKLFLRCLERERYKLLRVVGEEGHTHNMV